MHLLASTIGCRATSTPVGDRPHFRSESHDDKSASDLIGYAVSRLHRKLLRRGVFCSSGRV